MSIESSRVDDPFIDEVIATVPEGIISVGEEGTVVFATPSVEGLLGYAPEALVDHSIERLVPSSQEETTLLDTIRHQAGAATGPPESDAVDLLLGHKDGHDVPVALAVQATSYDQQRFFTATLRDISEQKAREQALEETETQFQKTFEYATDPLMIVDPQEDLIRECNSEICNLLGYSQEALLALGPSDVHPHDMDTFRAFVEITFEEGESWTDELRCRTADGETFPAEVAGTMLELEGRRHLLVRVRDITERGKRDPEPQETFDLFRKSFEYSNDAILIFDPISDEFEDVNPRACELLNYDREELLSMGPSDVYSHEIDTFREFVEAVLDEGAGWTDELSCSTREEDVVPVEISMSRIELDGGPHILASVRDIAERKEQEREFERYQTIVETVQDGIYTLDSQGRFTLVNDYIVERTGYSRDELLGSHVSRILDRDGVERGNKVIRELLTTDRTVGTYEATAHTADGEAIPIELHISLLSEAKGKFHESVGVAREITKRKAYEEQLKALNEASRELLSADTERAIAETAVGVVKEVLDRSLTALWRYDTETDEDVLRPLAASEGATELIDAADPPDVLPPIQAGTVEMAVFREGELRLLENYGTRENRAHPEMPLERRLIVPLKSHGVLAVGATGDEEIDAAMQDLVDIVAQSTCTAFDRLEREREVRQRSTAMEAAIDGMAILDDSGEYVYVNEAHADVYGFDVPEALLGKSWQRLYDDDETDRFEREILPTVREQGHWRGEAVGTRADGTTFPQDVSLAALEDGGLVCVIRDITERKEYERCLKELHAATRTLMEADTPEETATIAVEAADEILGLPRTGLHLLDEDAGGLAPVAWTDGLTRQLDDEPPTFDPGQGLAWDTFETGEASYWPNLRDVDGLYNPETQLCSEFQLPLGEHGVLLIASTTPDAFTETQLELAHILATSIEAALDRIEYEEQLEALNVTSQELTRAETAEEVARTGLQAMERLLGVNVGCVRFFDADANALESVARTDEADELVASRPAFDLEKTLASRAYCQDVIVRNEGHKDDLYGEMSALASLHLPLGEHGVVTVCRRDAKDFVDLELTLAEALAASVRAALDRATREETLRSNEHELRQQHEQLDTLHRITSLVQEIGDHLIEATTRAELEQTVCNRLVASELFQSAWTGEVAVTADRVDVHVGAGIDDTHLDALDELPLEMLGNGTVEQMIETGELQVVRQYQARDSDPAQEAGEPEQRVEATAAIPLAYGDRVHGVLVVNGRREDVFSENALAGFESLGRLAGFAVTALRTRELLLSDAVVELDLTVVDPTIFYSAVTAALDCVCRFDRSVPLGDGKTLNYHLVEGAEPAHVLEMAADADRIEDAQVVSERAEGFVLQTVTDVSLSQLALQAGASVRSAVVEDSQARVTLEAPQSADIREVVEVFEEAFSNVDVVAKRERERAVQTATEFRQSVAERLTEKQRAALEAAYASGYFEWPRELTGEELAESIGVSGSTLHQHLRNGIRNLLVAFLEESRIQPT